MRRPPPFGNHLPRVPTGPGAQTHVLIKGSRYSGRSGSSSQVKVNITAGQSCAGVVGGLVRFSATVAAAVASSDAVRMPSVA